MRYVSTAGRAGPVSFREALFQGLAPDGGLYVPESIPRLDWLADMESWTLPRRAAALLHPFVVPDLTRDALERIVSEAIDFPLPLVPLAGRRFALELFHGPTAAFKDVGARVMARTMAALAPDAGSFTVLVATSGDTGSAVAHAFAGVPGARIVLLYPAGQVSDLQEAQLTTGGEQVQALRVAGTFDDCQRLVKQAFADAALARAARLTSANSINIGRLLPQMIFYVELMRQLPADARRGVVVSVPSGNFGNLTAGVLAARAGVPIGGFIAATTINDVVPRYLETARYEPRPSTPTLANAMDVGAPSNFARIRWIYGDDHAALRRDIRGSAHTDEDVRDAIGRVWREHGYLLDPHSAIAWLALERPCASQPPAPAVFLATAHPAKFADVVEPILGEPVPLPARLARVLARPRHLVDLPPEYGALRATLERF